MSKKIEKCYVWSKTYHCYLKFKIWMDYNPCATCGAYHPSEIRCITPSDKVRCNLFEEEIENE